MFRLCSRGSKTCGSPFGGSPLSPRLRSTHAYVPSGPGRAGLGALPLAGFALGTTPAAAIPNPQAIVNPGGGALADGSDGLKISLNISGRDQVEFAGTTQWCCGASAPMLNIGGSLYGTAGPAGFGATAWDTITVDNVTGSTTTTNGTSAGSGTATVHYSVTRGGRLYQMDREIVYTSPERSYRENYTFTIPAGNTDVVKFYLGGDAAPGSSDVGLGESATTPVRSIVEVNPVSQFKFGFREVASSKAFDGAVVGSFNAPYATVAAGGDIGFSTQAATHDAGLMVQWNLGSTPGTVQASMEQFADFAPQAPPGGYVPLTPARLIDTRTTDPVAAGSVTELLVAGVGGVPADATSVVLNIGVDGPAAAGFVTAYPCGADLPLASNVNFLAAETASNGATVKVGDAGKVCLYSSVATHLIVDVNGAQSPTVAGEKFAGAAPVRLLDTRTAGARVAAGSVTELTVAGAGNVPADATAAVLNVTVTGPADGGFVTVYPCGADLPLASNLNFAAGDEVANAVVAKIGTAGKVCFFASAALDLVVDAGGAFGPSGDETFGDLVPARLLDTRETTKPAADATTELLVRGHGGVPAEATSVVLNVTAVDAAEAGFVTVFACGGDMPLASNVNYVAGQTVPNAVIVPLSADGKVCLYTKTSTHLVVDVTGAFSAPVPT